MGKVASLTVTLVLWRLSTTLLWLEGAGPLTAAAVLQDMAEEMHETMDQAAEGVQGAMEEAEEQAEGLAESAANVVGNLMGGMKSGFGDMQGAGGLEASGEVGAAGNALYDYAGSSEAGAEAGAGLEADYEAETAAGADAEYEAGETGQSEYATADYQSGEVATNADINAAYSSAGQDAMTAGGGVPSAETAQYETSAEQPTDPNVDQAVESSEEGEEEEVVEGEGSHEEAAMSGLVGGVQGVNTPLSGTLMDGFSMKQNIPSGNGFLAMPSPVSGVPGLPGIPASVSLGPQFNPSALSGFPNSLASGVPSLSTNLQQIPANLPPLPANLPPLPANLPPLPANLPPLPANLPPLPANLPPLPANLPPLPGNFPALPNMPALPAGASAFPGLPGRRRKRWISRAAQTIGRLLFGKFGRTHSTKSGSRVTQHYSGKGNYQTAVEDFHSMNPTNVRPFNSGKISGQTGKVGDYRVTVRDGSTKGDSRPTLSVHNDRKPGRDRKFRYNP